MSEDSSARVLSYASGETAVPGRMTRLLRTRSFWALADQGIASAANFLTIIIVTRHLTTTAFGEFSLLWESMLFLNGLHAALIVYPLSVRGAKMDPEHLRRLGTVATILTMALAVPFGGAMFGLGAWRGAAIGVTAATAIVAFHVHEALRRALMAQFRYTDLIRGDVVGYAGMVIAVALLARTGHLTDQSVFLAMTGTFSAAALVQASRLKPVAADPQELRSLTVEFWVLGRWMLASNLTAIFTGIGVLFCLKWFRDATHVANFQAMSNLVRFANPVLAAMTGLIVPAVALHGRARAARKYALLGGAILAPYFGLLLLVPNQAISFLYGPNSEYAGFPIQARIAVATAAVGYVTAMLSAILGGLGRSKAFFYTQVVNTLATVILTIPAAILWGWNGAIVAALLSTSLTGASALIFLWQYRKGHAG